MRRKRWRTVVGRRVSGVLALALLWCAKAAHSPSLAAALDEPSPVTLSIVGTSDLHGAASPRNGSLAGGLPLLAGYVNNLRAARASDGGAVLLIDSGDTFQGDVESNLSEGAVDRRRLQRDGLHRGGDRQPRFRLRIGRLAVRAAVAGRSARCAQGTRRPGALPVSRGEPDRRGDRPAGRVAERPAVGARRSGRHQSRHCRRHDDRRAAVDHRRQRAGTADRAARRRRSPPNASTLRAAGAECRHRGGACRRTLRAIRSSPRICRRASPSRRSSGSRTACPMGWSTSSPPATRTAGSRIWSTASPSSSRSRAASRSAASTSSSIGGRDTSCGRSPSLRNRS